MKYEYKKTHHETNKQKTNYEKQVQYFEKTKKKKKTVKIVVKLVVG